MKNGVVAGDKSAILGIPECNRKLSNRAQERALGVLADPLALKKAGVAVPLLAVVSERCGDGDECRFKYQDLARELGVAPTTLKNWAADLVHLGYFTREACGPSGVIIRLCQERWPSRERSGAFAVKSQHTVEVLNALRVTIDGALAAAAADVRKMGEEAA